MMAENTSTSPPGAAWRRGLRVDVSGADLLLLDAERGRLVRLTGPAAAFALGGDDAPAPDVRTLIAAHLRGLGLLDASGEGAGLLDADRRSVLAATGAAVLGIAVLALPSAASAASVGGSTLGVSAGSSLLDLPLARATWDMDAGTAFLAGSRDRTAAMRTVDLQDGTVSATATILRAAPPTGQGTFPRDIVRLGARAYVVYVTIDRETYFEGILDGLPGFVRDTVLGTGVIEVALDAEGGDGLEVVRTLTNVDIRGTTWAMYTCIATDGTNIFLGGVVEEPASGGGDAPELATVLERLVVPSDAAVAMNIEPGVSVPPPPGEDQLAFLHAMVVADGAIYAHAQLHPSLDDLFDETPALIARFGIDDGLPSDITAVRQIGPAAAESVILGGVWPQPALVVFAGNLYVADVAFAPDEQDGSSLSARLHRFELDSDAWGSGPGPDPDPDPDLDPDPDPSSDPEVEPPPGPDQTLVFPRTQAEDFVSPILVSLLRIGGTLLLSGLDAVRRIDIGAGGVLVPPADPPSGADIIDLIPQLIEIVEERDADAFDLLGIGPGLPAKDPLRAYFGLGKGKSGLIEITL